MKNFSDLTEPNFPFLTAYKKFLERFQSFLVILDRMKNSN